MAQLQELKISLRKDDRVEVIAGKEKGKTGKVLRVYPKSGRVLVEKVNLVKRHVRPTQQNPQGGILEKELPLHLSNVLLFCPKCNRGVRHGKKMTTGKNNQKKIRVCKKCDSSLEAV